MIKKIKDILYTLWLFAIAGSFLYGSYVMDEFEIKKQRALDLAPICSNCGHKILPK